ncbi:MAG: TldD/PmbA family protein [Bacillota bacterium]
MKDLLKTLVQSGGADYLEVRVEESHVTRLGFKGRELDHVGKSIEFGGNIRALVNGGWGFVSFNELEDLESRLQLACAQARLSAHTEGCRLASVPVVEDYVTLDVVKDPRQLTLADKMALMGSYNDIILSYGRPIQSSNVSYNDKHTRLYFASSEGTYIEQEKLDLSGSITAMATRGGNTQMGRVGFGSSRDFGVAEGLEGKVREACRKAVDLLDAPVVTGGEYTVICDPRLAGIFAHEAFGHLSEGDDVSENPSLAQVMTLGTQFGLPILSIYDSGQDPGARGYLRYDDEGVPTEKTYLIREGVLVGRLHSRRTAGRMGERPTGNARALDYRFPPICRMRNTCIEAGEATFDDMLEGVKLGLYVVSSFGGQTNGEMFTFSAGEAYMIRDGRLAEPVRDVNLTGNVFATLRNIDMVGCDFTPHESAGGCGKGNQGPLPTSEWAPHIRIRNVVVGGKK